MLYDIYFHNDFDGRASAAITLAFLRERGDDIVRYTAMTYGKESAWYDEHFFDKGNPAIVVDFTYHPKAAWWFDHHPSAFKKIEWKKRFTPDAEHHLDLDYPSCCGLVYASLKRDFGWKPPRHFKQFVTSADMIDSAGYHSARETIEMKSPDLQLDAFIEGLPHTAAEDKLLIGLMATQPLAKIVRHPEIAKALVRLRKNVTKSLAFHQKNLQVFERSTFINLANDPLNGLLRFAPYYLCPTTDYSFRMKPRHKLWYLGVAKSPWRDPKREVDLGSLMRERYHGGGHKGVGATEFKTKADALRAFEYINALLNS